MSIGLGREVQRPVWVGLARVGAGAAAVVLVFLMTRLASPEVVQYGVYGNSPLFSLGLGPGGSSMTGRLSTFYFPSIIEWVSSAGVIAFCIILLSLGLTLLPIEGEVVTREDHSGR